MNTFLAKRDEIIQGSFKKKQDVTNSGLWERKSRVVGKKKVWRKQDICKKFRNCNATRQRPVIIKHRQKERKPEDVERWRDEL